MRGIWVVPGGVVVGAGIIPAGAGHFLCVRCRGVVLWDHPRRCGAFLTFGVRDSDGIGSSPQVRGIYPPRRRFLVCSGIIPAGAGHLIWVVTLAVSPGDHPRRCGAFLIIATWRFLGRGSSPQVRGISATTRPFPLSWRIIPAGAGHLLVELEYRSKIFLSNAIL